MASSPSTSVQVTATLQGWGYHPSDRAALGFRTVLLSFAVCRRAGGDNDQDQQLGPSAKPLIFMGAGTPAEDHAFAGDYATVVEAEALPVTEIAERLFGNRLGGSAQHFAMAEVLAFPAYYDTRRQAQRLRGPDGVFRWYPIRASGRH